jgi:hypothetical protein
MRHYSLSTDQFSDIQIFNFLLENANLHDKIITKIKKATHQFARLSLAMIIIPRIISLVVGQKEVFIFSKPKD